MTFDSIIFFIFFVIILLLYHCISNWYRRKIILLIGSYFFYAIWNPPYVLLLFFSTIFTWGVGNKLILSEDPKKRKLLLFLGLVGTLGVLAFFKYSFFLLENLISILSSVGIHYQPPVLDILLPIGISFYTFQALSYVLDCYRRTQKEPESLTDFALYVSFFPQLVAGPIVRTGEFIPQCKDPRSVTFSHFGWGIFLLILGLFMKVVLADAFLAPVVDKIYTSYLNINAVDTWVGVFAYSGQIYFDFAGYSTCAIGVAMCFGFGLPDNFRYPYAAIGFSEFWKRWHISLSRWMRDYLYISIGGNKEGKSKEYRNLFMTMLIAGLWHGASWLFVLWGGLHGIFLVIEHVIKKRISLRFMPDFILSNFLIAITFLVVTLTWIPFRSPDVFVAVNILTSLFGNDNASLTGMLERIEVIVIISLLFIWQLFMKHRDIESVIASRHWVIRGLLLAVLLISVVLVEGGDNRAYIYFQF